jgi:large subunit ribosomal protein L16
MNTFIPKKFKFKKIHKNVRIKNTDDFKLNELRFSVCGLKILKSGTISSTVLEAARRIIKRKTKKLGTLKINAFANIPITTKASGVRMGKGVGSISK